LGIEKNIGGGGKNRREPHPRIVFYELIIFFYPFLEHVTEIINHKNTSRCLYLEPRADSPIAS
jgi:hypothetical protein